MKLWSKRIPLNMPECHYCPALGICGGGCVFNAEILNGGINKRDKSFCVHTQKALAWLLIQALITKFNTDDIFINDISFMYH